MRARPMDSERKRRAAQHALGQSAGQVEAMRRDGEIPKGVHALVLDADDAITKCWEYGAFACPAVVLMRGDGTLMTVQRPLVGDDCKVSGPLTRAASGIQLLHAATERAAVVVGIRSRRHLQRGYRHI